MELERIHHIAILVSDYETSRDFYVNKLGFQVIRETRRPERGDIKLDVQKGACVLEIFWAPNRPPRPTNPEAYGLRHLCFATENIEASVSWLNSLGIETEPIRIDTTTDRKFTFFQDPDGLPLELHE